MLHHFYIKFLNLSFKICRHDRDFVHRPEIEGQPAQEGGPFEDGHRVGV